MHARSRFVALALGLALPLLVAATSGFPSRPNFRQATVSITGADARVIINNSTSGNAYVSTTTVGQQDWSFGADRSDSGNFKLAPTANLTLPVLTVAADGLMTGRGLASSAIKTADTSRASTATLAVDPNLQISLPAVGSYVVRARLDFDAGAGGIRWAWSGGATVSSGRCNYRLENAGVGIGAGALGRQNKGVTVTWSAVGESIAIECGITISATGTLTLEWAQNTSNAANTTVLAGSYLSALRV
jgi:hypothetical protein